MNLRDSFHVQLFDKNIVHGQQLIDRVREKVTDGMTQFQVCQCNIHIKSDGGG